MHRNRGNTFECDGPGQGRAPPFLVCLWRSANIQRNLPAPARSARARPIEFTPRVATVDGNRCTMFVTPRSAMSSAHVNPIDENITSWRAANNGFSCARHTIAAPEIRLNIQSGADVRRDRDANIAEILQFAAIQRISDEEFAAPPTLAIRSGRNSDGVRIGWVCVLFVLTLSHTTVTFDIVLCNRPAEVAADLMWGVGAERTLSASRRGMGAGVETDEDRHWLRRSRLRAEGNPQTFHRRRGP